MSDVIYRKLDDRDLSVAIDIIHGSFKIDGHSPDDYNFQRVRRRIIDSLYEEHPDQFIVAEVNDEVVGVAGYGKMLFASHTYALFLSAVVKEHRGKGIGSSLVSKRIEMIGEESEHGFSRILVSTKHPKRFIRLGFSSIDENEHTDTTMMVKVIGRDITGG